MNPNKIVSREVWIEARKALLRDEKEFTRQRDALTAKRQALPWVKLEKDYVFKGADGPLTLRDLFDGKDQLIIYHFMFGPDWAEGCSNCSFWADNFNGVDIHLENIDITLAMVSSAPIDKVLAYRDRMGWTTRWVSAEGSDFNRDFGVTFTAEETKRGEQHYNYGKKQFPSTEAPGVSVFAKGEDGAIYHTYSTYSRGLDMLNGAYHYIDLTPKGRRSEKEHGNMHWLKRRDQYSR